MSDAPRRGAAALRFLWGAHIDNRETVWWNDFNGAIQYGRVKSLRIQAWFADLENATLVMH